MFEPFRGAGVFGARLLQFAFSCGHVGDRVGVFTPGQGLGFEQPFSPLHLGFGISQRFLLFGHGRPRLGFIRSRDQQFVAVNVDQRLSLFDVIADRRQNARHTTSDKSSDPRRCILVESQSPRHIERLTEGMMPDILHLKRRKFECIGRKLDAVGGKISRGGGLGRRHGPGCRIPPTAEIDRSYNQS